MDSPWPDEPEEPDPEARWGTPERDLPREPEVRIPDSEPDEETEIDPDLQRTFWAAVVLANVAIFGLAVGPMLVYFRGMWIAGAALVGLGLFFLVRTYTVYRDFRADNADEGDPREPDGADATDGDAGRSDGGGDARLREEGAAAGSHDKR